MANDMQFTNLQASNFIFNEDLEHPNKLPFSGILTYFDVPSDEAPHGSGGRKVLIPSEVGVPALQSVVGMAVNLVDGREHAPQDKIGIITSADVGEPNENGTPVYVEGYIFAHDFPDHALDIKLNQSLLGFSYETTNTLLRDGIYSGEPVAIVDQIVFTGASILKALDGAYTKTSLAASAETETQNEGGEPRMDNETLIALKEAIKHIDAITDQVMAQFGIPDQDKVEDSEATEVQASADEAQASAEEPPVEEPPVEETPVEEEKTEDEQAPEEAPEEEETPEEETPEGATEAEASLQAAADLKAELEKVRKELADLRAAADLQASARKSIAFPKTLIQKYELNEEEEETKLMASIEEREDLSIEERMALKFEMRDKKKKQQSK